MSLMPLTPVQKMVLDFMREFFRENDQLPPAHAIAAHFKWKAKQNADAYRMTLEKKCYLERNAVGKLRFARKGKTGARA